MNDPWGDWHNLLEALHFTGPMGEYEIVSAATKRIKHLEEILSLKDYDAIRWAKEVLPDAHMHDSDQAIWALVAEIVRLRATAHNKDVALEAYRIEEEQRQDNGDIK